jgi:endonuclease YncB( thermonuclease family)
MLNSSFFFAESAKSVPICSGRWVAWSDGTKKRGIMVIRKAVFYILVTMLVATPSHTWAWSGEVVGITDGDTITVLNSKTLKDVKIHLYGIDTPERGQAFSKRARQFTSKTVYGKVVEVKVMATDR